MITALRCESWCELPVPERVDRGQPMPFLDECGKFIRRLFNLSKDLFRILQNLVDDDHNRVVLGPELVMGICKIANDLVAVRASRSLGARVWSRKQRHVIALSVRTIDKRSLLRDAYECFSAVGTLTRVPLQWGTPLGAGRICNDVIKGGRSRRKSDVRKTLSINSSEVHGNTRTRKPLFGVQETCVFRTGANG